MPSKKQCQPSSDVREVAAPIDPVLARPATEPPSIPTFVPPAERGGCGDLTAYRRVADEAATFWLHTFGPAPWLNIRWLNALNPRNSAPLLLRRQFAALGSGVLLQLQPNRPDHDHIREAVRTALIGWQRSLRTDGVPAHRHVRGSALHGLTAGAVVALLEENPDFQNAMLLRDVERHLLWLAAKPPQTPWIESAAIVALADGALLARRGELLGAARKKLADLLLRQDEEGWFPERGGADVGRLSLTVDALARLLTQHEWTEAGPAIGRAMRFMTHLVHPGGRTGGCYGSCHTSFISPYGAELLAAQLPEAATLAGLCRARSAELGAAGLFGHDDDLWTLLGAKVAMAAEQGAVRPAAATVFPHASRGVAEFPHAGLTIISKDAYHAVINGKKGGAMRVTWRDGGMDLEDAGVTVVYPHRIQTSSRFDRRAGAKMADSVVSCHGILRGFLRTPEASYGWLLRWFRRRGRERAPIQPVPSPGHSTPRDRLTHDRFTREVTFGDDWVKIVDRVHCRLPCETIICQSPPNPQPGLFGVGNAADRTRRPPILVEGGRHVEITRVYRRGALVDQRSEPTRRLD